MTKIEEFVKLITGRFDNKEQFDAMKKAGKTYPYAQHVNTVCNDKIKNRPVISFTNSSIFVKAYLQNISQSLGIFGPAKSRPANSISSYTHTSMVVYYQLS